MRVFNQTVVTAQALNVSSNSAFVPLRSIFLYTMAAIITGTPTGSLKLQASNDPETNDTQPLSNNPPTNWVDVANSTFTVTTASEVMWNVQFIGYNYVRVVYTDTSGGASAATMKIVFNGKGD